ncbi:EamA family transporter [Thermoflexus sp.]|nr:EamA family transporter [Thermoflexus sp.]MCS6964282.1 EamA family transporter [Thermoflexus sp.]MCX7689291.1 EamA family transporter [Thermoflexus sp.]MDW8185297.1 EamA family transporter [Anaerolineae bacterium]
MKGIDLFLLVALGAIWGGSYLFFALGVKTIPPLTFVAGRLLIGTAMLWGFRNRPQRGPAGDPPLGAFLVMGLFNAALPHTLIAWSEQTIPSGLAGVLIATMPLWTAGMTRWMLREEQPSRRQLGGLLVGFLGIVVLLFPDLRRAAHAHLLGEAAVLIAAISYAGATVYARKALRGVPPIEAAIGQLLSGGLMVLPLSLILDRPWTLSPAPVSIAALLALAVLGTAIAYVMYFQLLQRVGVVGISLVTYLNPIFAVIWGALWLGEPLSGWVLGGMALILAGVFLAGR